MTSFEYGFDVERGGTEVPEDIANSLDDFLGLGLPRRTYIAWACIFERAEAQACDATWVTFGEDPRGAEFLKERDS
jgi:hypothetical protein